MRFAVFGGTLQRAKTPVSTPPQSANRTPHISVFCDFTNLIIIKMSNEIAGFLHSLYLLYIPVFTVLWMLFHEMYDFSILWGSATTR